jgi:hypothetical protein
MDPCIAHMQAMGQDTFDSIVDNSKRITNDVSVSTIETATALICWSKQQKPNDL